MTHNTLEMQLVRVSRILKASMVGDEETTVRGSSSGLSCVELLQDSLGSCRVPETSLFAPHLMSDSGRGSLQASCSEESHCLWMAKETFSIPRDHDIRGLKRALSSKAMTGNTGHLITLLDRKLAIVHLQCRDSP